MHPALLTAAKPKFCDDRAHSLASSRPAALARPYGVYKAAHVRLVNIFYLEVLLYRYVKVPDAMHPALFYNIDIPIFRGKLHHIVFRKIIQPHTAKRHTIRRTAVDRQMIVQGEDPAFIVRMNFSRRPVTGHKHFILKINPLIVR